MMLSDSVVQTSEVKRGKRVAILNSGVVRMSEAKWMSGVS